MDKKLQEIIKKSRVSVKKGNYIYAKVSVELNLEDCFMVSRDKDEITAVFEESKTDRFEVIDKNKDLYRLIELKVSVPFYAVGFLAAVTGAISAKGANNLVVSTFSKDYVLVRIEQLDLALGALKELGFNF
jgi:hypothetical protein